LAQQKSPNAAPTDMMKQVSTDMALVITLVHFAAAKAFLIFRNCCKSLSLDNYVSLQNFIQSTVQQRRLKLPQSTLQKKKTKGVSKK